MFPGDAIWPLPARPADGDGGDGGNPGARACIDGNSQLPTKNSSLMKRLLEWIFGLDRGFLNQEGDLSIPFPPRWPGQAALDYVFTKIGFGAAGATVWNLVLITLAVMLVV